MKNQPTATHEALNLQADTGENRYNTNFIDPEIQQKSENGRKAIQQAAKKYQGYEDIFIAGAEFAIKLIATDFDEIKKMKGGTNE
jgi:hypothetical protein